MRRWAGPPLAVLVALSAAASCATPVDLPWVSPARPGFAISGAVSIPQRGLSRGVALLRFDAPSALGASSFRVLRGPGRFQLAPAPDEDVEPIPQAGIFAVLVDPGERTWLALEGLDAEGASVGRTPAVPVEGVRYGIERPWFVQLEEISDPATCFGRSIDLGDLDGDGSAELAVGAPWFDAGGAEGYVGVFFGRDTYSPQTFDGDGLYGWDLDIGSAEGADGLDDLFVGAPYRDDVDSGFTDVGGVGVFLGNVNLGTQPFVPFRTFENAVSQSGFGASVQLISDASSSSDGSYGLPDLAIAAPFDNSGYGSIRIHPGFADGLSSSSWLVYGPLDGSAIGESMVGRLVTPFPSATPSGSPTAAYWFYSAERTLDPPSPSPSSPTPTPTPGPGGIYGTTSNGFPQTPSEILLTQGETDTERRTVVANAGDLDGDGYEDLLVGGPGYDSGRGQFLVFGGDGLVQRDAITGASAGAGLGRAFARAGDLDYDGFEDFFVTGNGFVQLYFGGEGAPQETEGWFLPNTAPGFGVSIATGDRRGDGYRDVAIGAASCTLSAGPGSTDVSADAVFVYHRTPPIGPALVIGSFGGLAQGTASPTAAAVGWSAGALRCEWEWGDGETTTVDPCDTTRVRAVTHTWSGPGTYEVRLRATSDEFALEGEAAVVVEVP